MQRVLADLAALVDSLDELVHRAKVVPLTGQVRVDHDEINDIVDEMRVTVATSRRSAPADQRHPESPEDWSSRGSS
jgi:hypothetical protein